WGYWGNWEVGRWIKSKAWPNCFQLFIFDLNFCLLTFDFCLDLFAACLQIFILVLVLVLVTSIPISHIQPLTGTGQSAPLANTILTTVPCFGCDSICNQ